MNATCGYCGGYEYLHSADDLAHCRRQLVLFGQHPEWLATPA